MSPLKKLPNAIDRQIGRRIKERRTLIGLNQQALADAIGVSYQQVQKYENGTDRVGASRLYAIAEALRMPISYFYDDAGERSGSMAPGFRESWSEMPSTADGRELILAFNQIRDDEVRRKLVELALALANSLIGPDPVASRRPVRGR